MSDISAFPGGMIKGLYVRCAKCDDRFKIIDLPVLCKCGEKIKAIKSITIGPDKTEIEYKEEE